MRRRRKRVEKEMSDEEFKRRLTKAMKKHGIPCPTMKEVIGGGAMFGTTVQVHDFDERSLEGWLEAKQYRDEVRACLGRRVPLDELFF